MAGRNLVARLKGAIGLGGESAVSGGGNSVSANRCVIFGDSITKYNTALVSNANANQARGYMTWANALLGRRRLDVVANLGVGGDTTAQMLARVDVAAAIDAPWAVVLGGINDLAGNLLSAQTVISNLQLIYQRLAGSGKRIIAISVLPVTPAHPLYSLALIARIQQVNRWIATYCATTSGMVFVDGYGAVVDPTSSASAPLTGYYADVTHPGVSGAYAVGAAIASAVYALIAPLDSGSSGVGNTYLTAQRTLTSLVLDGTTATANLAAINLIPGDVVTVEGATPAEANGTFVVLAVPTTGSATWACAASAGTATGTIKFSNGGELLDNPLFGTPASGLASSWTKSENNTTTTTTTVPRTDNFGNWQQMAIVASAAGSAYIQGGDNFSRVFAGETVVIEAEIELDTGHTSLDGIQVVINMIIGGVTYTVVAMQRLSGSVFPATPKACLYRTEPFVIPPGAVTRFRPQVYVFFSAAGAATVRVGRASVRKLR